MAGAHPPSPRCHSSRKEEGRQGAARTRGGMQVSPILSRGLRFAFPQSELRSRGPPWGHGSLVLGARAPRIVIVRSLAQGPLPSARQMSAGPGAQLMSKAEAGLGPNQRVLGREAWDSRRDGVPGVGAEDRRSAGWRGAAWHTRAHACSCPVRGSPGLAWETQRRSPRVREPRAPPRRPLPALTVSRRHLFSLMAPMQPTKPMAMTRVPVTMSRLAADREGKEEDRVAKFPCVAASQMPTPRMPQPPSWDRRGREREVSCRLHALRPGTAGQGPAGAPRQPGRRPGHRCPPL